MNAERFSVNLLAVLACGTIIGAMIRLPPVMSANDGSRWNTVWSLNAGKGYVIDEAPYETCDKVIRGGRLYSSKPALMPTVVAGLAWLIKQAVGMSLPDYGDFVVRAILIFINVLPFGAMIVLYGRLLERLGHGFPTRMFCVGVAAFGTYLTSYSVTLNNHTQAAWAAFFALYCLIRIEYEGQTQRRYFFLGGLSAAWAVANEMPAALFAAAVLGILLRSHWRRALLYFCPPCAAMGAAFLYTTYLATGSLIPYTFNPDPSLGIYPGSLWINTRGIDALHEPKLVYVFHMLLGHHGIFSLTPVFAFSLYGAFLKSRLRRINQIGLALTLYLFVSYAFRTANYGGGCLGIRWLFWLIPFWLISLAPAVEKHIDSRLFRLFAYAALLVSLVSVGFGLSALGVYGFVGPWGFSWIHLIFRWMNWVNY